MSGMRLILAAIFISGAIPTGFHNAANTDSKIRAIAESHDPGYLTEPTLSPDGKEIAFVSGGDIWTVSAGGGEARLLIAHPAEESRPFYSPDGKQLAFVSTRTGNGDIYLWVIETGRLKRLTFDDASEVLSGWSYDGQWIYFSSTRSDIGGMSDIYRIRAGGGTALEVSADSYLSEYFGAPSPDGRSLAFTARGTALSQWWRKGHSRRDESEIWLLHEGSSNVYEPVISGRGKNAWPMWSADGNKIFYVSDKNGTQNIWVIENRRKIQQITSFKDGRVLWPTISYDGRTIVFEHNFKIWKLQTTNGEITEVGIRRRGLQIDSKVEHLTLTNQIQELKLSPDGEKVAFVVRGEIFAASARDGGEAVRVTRNPANDDQIDWAPDSNSLVYVSHRTDGVNIFLYDFLTRSERQLTVGACDYSPRFSPDGAVLAFQRDGREVRTLNLHSKSKQESVAAVGHLEKPPFSSERTMIWSPDGRWIAFMGYNEKLHKNVYVAAVDGNGGSPISYLANYGGNSLSWGPDGSYIFFHTGQRTEDGRIARIVLWQYTQKFREDHFRELFKETVPRTASASHHPESKSTSLPASADNPTQERKNISGKTVKINFEGIRQRLSLLSLGLDVADHVLSPDGKWLLVNALASGRSNLYLCPLNEGSSHELGVVRQLTSTAGSKRYAQFTPDGKEIYYLEQGRINIVTVNTSQSQPLSVTAEMEVDFDREKMEVFRQVFTIFRDHFFDTEYNGVNWQAVRDTYAPYVATSQTPEEFRKLMLLMLGELNSSHLGLTSIQTTSMNVGKLGLRFDRAAYESSGALKVTSLVPFGPAALTSKIKPGDYLTAIDGRSINTGVNLDELLLRNIDRRVALTVADSADNTNIREVVVKPVNSAAEKDLRYLQWTAERRAYVERVSGGRLGYVHMLDMSPESLQQLSVDLDAENRLREGVVVDLRHNNGGFVSTQAIDVFARRGDIRMKFRGLPETSARLVLGQRALDLPTILVTNQNTVSDAEEFTELYRTLNLGKIVGEPTAGWAIYTQSVRLIDGSVLRIPNTKLIADDGTLLEMHPRPVDLQIVAPVGESYTGSDSQLAVAVKALLKQIDDPKRMGRR